MTSFVFLDSVWKYLFTLTTTVSVLLTLAIVGSVVLRGSISSEKAKRILNIQLLMTSILSFVGVFVLNIFDPELIAGCFEKFAVNSNSYTITRLVAGAYLATLLGAFLRDIYLIGKAQRYHRQLPTLVHRELNQLILDLSLQLQIRKRFLVLKDSSAKSPYVWGLLKPRLIVDSYLLNCKNQDQVRTVLAHELMHIQGNDTAWSFLAHLLRRLFFFNPICYLFCRAQSLVTEMAADEKALRQCEMNPKVLLASIIEMAESNLKNQQSLLHAYASREFKEVQVRARALINQPKTRQGPYQVFLFGSLILSVMTTALQARAFLNQDIDGGAYEERMCLQVHHEKVIESLLRIENAQKTNTCEIN